MACRHFPHAVSIRCPLCNPEAVFEIEQQSWNDEPIVEVLRDGEAWASPWDSNFRFGRVKTAMILSCIDTVQDFALTPNPGAMIPSPIINQADPDLIIQLQSFPTFTNSYGILIEEPFLRLDRVVHDKLTLHIGFGQAKAAALVILKNDLRNWLRSVRGWYRG